VEKAKLIPNGFSFKVLSIKPFLKLLLPNSIDAKASVVSPDDNSA